VVVALEKTSVGTGDPADASRIPRSPRPRSPIPPAPTGGTTPSIRRSASRASYWADYPGWKWTRGGVRDRQHVSLHDQCRWTRPSLDRGQGSLRRILRRRPASVNVYNPSPTEGAPSPPCRPRCSGRAGPARDRHLPRGLQRPDHRRSRGRGKRPGHPGQRSPGESHLHSGSASGGDIENYGGTYGSPALPDAPQLGSTIPIEVNDRRSLDAVWRDGALWFTTTINPNGSDPGNDGEATAHWFKLDTGAVLSSASPGGLIALADQGNLGGEDVAAGTYLLSLGGGERGRRGPVRFAGSASTIYAGAYVAGRHANDPAGRCSPPDRPRGVASYVRTFNGPRNRWGDYSRICLSPGDDRIFWVFNQYAWTNGSPTSPPTPAETGRWRTAVATPGLLRHRELSRTPGWARWPGAEPLLSASPTAGPCRRPCPTR
jgi:hypothetical protein